MRIDIIQKYLTFYKAGDPIAGHKNSASVPVL